MKNRKMWFVGMIFFAGQIIFAGEWKATAEPVELIRHDNEVCMNPLWSPDGKFLAFTSANYRGILIWDAAGGEIREINDEIGAGFGMSWGKNGTQLLARVAQYRGFRRYSAVRIFNLTENKTLTVVPFQKSLPDLPRWTAQGNVYYADRKAVREVAVSRRKGPQTAASRAHTLFVIQRRALAKQSGVNGNISQVEKFAGKRIINLSWSPDFTKIVFEAVGGNMFIMTADGEDIVDLGPGDRPGWSPDSQAITFMVSTDNGHHFTASDIFIINADGSGRSRITHTDDVLEMNPAWGPAGKSLVYDVPGQGVIYSIAVSQIAE